MSTFVSKNAQNEQYVDFTVRSKERVGEMKRENGKKAIEMEIEQCEFP